MKKEISNIKKLSLIVIAIILSISIYLLVVNIYNKTKDIKQFKEEVTSEALYTLEDYPKVDASLATQPLADAFIKNFTATEEIDKEAVQYSNTHPGYVKLINDEVDLIIVTEPSEEELELAKQNGIELEVIPVVKEGFVFYVNKQNKVDNLTVQEIQKIYTGETKNWEDVGGEDQEITPYQRPKNSSSQTGMISLVMKGLPLTEAPTENLVDTMYEIANLVSNYRNGKNALGYSYYYYAKNMLQSIDKEISNNIKLIRINDVEPNTKTIKDSSYPFTTAYYIVINKEDDEKSASRILANRMLSTRGQKIAEETGYIPVK